MFEALLFVQVDLQRSVGAAGRRAPVSGNANALSKENPETSGPVGRALSPLRGP